MTEIQRLMDRCAGGIRIVVDGHLEDATPIAEYIEMVNHFPGNSMRAPPEVVAEMIRLNRCVEVEAHRLTPNGHNDALHWNIDEAVRLVHESMDRDVARD